MKTKLGAVFCALFGHSRLVTNCFHYKYCARCRAQIGDGLLGTVPEGLFQIGQTCACDYCRRVFDSLTWRDKLLCPTAKWPDARVRTWSEGAK